MSETESQSTKNDEICIALTTAGSEDEARRLARLLVDQRLAACVNIIPGVRSVYHWKGKVEETGEAMLVMKTSRGQAPALQAALQQAHSYDVPEFLLLPVAGGGAAYLAWLRDGLRGGLKDL